MSWPAPTRAVHEKFCRIEGCAEVRDAGGRTGTHHRTYELALPDGRVLRTRISRPPDRGTYGAGMWAHILRDQLAVEPGLFWACVRGGEAPDRGARARPAGCSIPASLAAVFLSQVGLSDAEVAAMSRDEAIERVNQFWTTRL